MKLVIYLTLVVVLISCKLAEPVKVPNTPDVLEIEVMAGVMEQRKVVAEITEKQKIYEILTFISAHNKKWYKPWNTYPTPQATAVFRSSSNTPLLILWFGSNWVGGQDMPQGPKGAKLWELEEESLKELKRLLSIEGV
jgi:hypothetical protein